MTTIKISGALLRFTDYRSTVAVGGDTVGAALAELVTLHPDLKLMLFAPDGRPRSTHRFAVNGEVLSGEFLGRPVTRTDRVDILTAIFGG